jgi:hypothetical protein
VRVAHETYVQLARFVDDKAKWKKRGSRPAPPFDFVGNIATAAVNSDDDGDGACYAGDGADHAKKLHWLIAPGHCRPWKNELIALAGWLRSQ